MGNEETRNRIISDETEELDELATLLRTLRMDQIRFVVARQECSSDKAAAKEIGLTAGSVYHWENKQDVDRAAYLMARDGVLVAREMLRRNLPKAAAVKVAGLDLDDDRLRQSVSTEIIEWAMGRATQRQEHSGPGGGPLEIVYVNDWRRVNVKD